MGDAKGTSQMRCRYVIGIDVEGAVMAWLRYHPVEKHGRNKNSRPFRESLVSLTNVVRLQLFRKAWNPILSSTIFRTAYSQSWKLSNHYVTSTVYFALVLRTEWVVKCQRQLVETKHWNSVEGNTNTWVRLQVVQVGHLQNEGELRDRKWLQFFTICGSNSWIWFNPHSY